MANLRRFLVEGEEFTLTSNWNLLSNNFVCARGARLNIFTRPFIFLPEYPFVMQNWSFAYRERELRALFEVYLFKSWSCKTWDLDTQQAYIQIMKMRKYTTRIWSIWKKLFEVTKDVQIMIGYGVNSILIWKLSAFLIIGHLLYYSPS